jgi:hypothetical protein
MYKPPPTSPLTVPGYARTTVCFRAGIFARLRECNQLPVLPFDDADAQDEEPAPAPTLTRQNVFEIVSASEDSWTERWTTREDIRGSMCAEIASEAGFDDVRDVEFPPICHCMRRVVAVNPFSNVSCFRKPRVFFISPKSKIPRHGTWKCLF